MKQEDPLILDIEMKVCRDCKKNTENKDLVKNKLFKDGFDTLCLSCNRERVKKWRKKNPELRAEQLKKEGKKDYSRNKQYKRLYGITINTYNEMFSSQNGCCKICNKHQSEFKKRLVVDHNHSTGEIRGLLCSPCNSLIGFAYEKIGILTKAIDYLNTTPDTK